MDSERTNPFYLMLYTLLIHHRVSANRIEREKSGHTYHENSTDWSFKVIDFLLLFLTYFPLKLYEQFLYFFKYDAYVETEYILANSGFFYVFYQYIKSIILHYYGIDDDDKFLYDVYTIPTNQPELYMNSKIN